MKKYLIVLIVVILLIIIAGAVYLKLSSPLTVSPSRPCPSGYQLYTGPSECNNDESDFEICTDDLITECRPI